MPSVVRRSQAGWRWLGVFWLIVLCVGGSAAATLHVLGPPEMRPLPIAHTVNDHGPDPQAPGTDAPKPEAEHVPVSGPTAAAPGRVAAPIQALMEKSAAFPTAQLPKVAADGRVARLVYAAPAPSVPPGSARIALLLSGFGLAERDSQAAIGQLPGAVSLAVSSYVPPGSPLLAAAREAGHELLASIPMEPDGYPLNDEGARSLRTGLSPEENRVNLEWALSRTDGAVGATGASDGMRGERFADIPAVFDPMVEEVTRRGLLYVDARPGRTAPAGAPVRAVDVVLDDQLGRAEMDARLQSLERTAKEKGSAIGLVGSLHPVTIERIGAWIKTLQERGLVLVPVSAVVNP